MRRLIVGVLVGLASLAGCKSDALVCSSDIRCPGGHVCLAEKCEKMCASDSECVTGTHCNGDICVPGSREGVPTIDSVRGRSAQRCKNPDDDSDLGPCLGSGWVVTGKNLVDAEWELRHADSPTTPIALAVVGTETSTRVELSLADGKDILPGDYLLVVVNQAGQDESDLTLLRGEPGDGATLYFYDNSATAEVVAITRGRMHITLDAPVGESAEPVGVAIDDERLMDLCGDVDGCTVAVGGSGFNVGGNKAAPWMGMPCRFFIREASGQRHWSVTSACAQWYATWESNNNGSAAWLNSDRNGDVDTQPGFFAPYFSGTFGVDGVDGGGSDRTHVLNFERACYFSETEANPSGAAGALAADNNQGFFFFASGKGWDDGSNTYFSSFWSATAAGRTCELTIDD